MTTSCSLPPLPSQRAPQVCTAGVRSMEAAKGRVAAPGRATGSGSKERMGCSPCSQRPQDQQGWLQQEGRPQPCQMRAAANQNCSKLQSTPLHPPQCQQAAVPHVLAVRARISPVRSQRSWRQQAASQATDAPTLPSPSHVGIVSTCMACLTVGSRAS
eukprot:scaffold14671_cov30-Tisochrysis_lutea.AAC.1